MPPASAPTDVGGVSTFTSPCGRSIGVAQPANVNGCSAAATSRPARPRPSTTTTPAGSRSAAARHSGRSARVTGHALGATVRSPTGGRVRSPLGPGQCRRRRPGTTGSQSDGRTRTADVQRPVQQRHRGRTAASTGAHRRAGAAGRGNEHARDPQRQALVMAHESTVLVDKAAAIAGEHPSCRHGMEIAPRIHAIAQGHGVSSRWSPLRRSGTNNESTIRK